MTPAPGALFVEVDHHALACDRERLAGDVFLSRKIEAGRVDHGFDLHLRMDAIAEIYAVVKNTARGPAHSVEFFDERGGHIVGRAIGGPLGADAEHGDPPKLA